MRIPHLSPFAALGCVLLAGGCASLFKSEGLPDHPLFQHRKPVESKAESTPTNPIVVSEPLPPQNPYFEDYRANVARHMDRTVPGTLTNRTKKETPAAESMK